jgi:hypothetical protein
VPIVATGTEADFSVWAPTCAGGVVAHAARTALLIEFDVVPGVSLASTPGVYPKCDKTLVTFPAQFVAVVEDDAEVIVARVTAGGGELGDSTASEPDTGAEMG